MKIKYSNIPRDEAVQTMAESIKECDRCKFDNQSLCAYHQAEVREMQYEFTKYIQDEIFEVYFGKTDKEV